MQRREQTLVNYVFLSATFVEDCSVLTREMKTGLCPLLREVNKSAYKLIKLGGKQRNNQ